MKDYICNYAVMRFRPYKDIGEFVNIGIILSCPQIGFLKYKLDTKHAKRLSYFFPELNIDIFKKGRTFIKNELDRCLTLFNEQHDLRQSVFNFESERNNNIFNYLTSIKENMFIFGDISTGFANNPENKINELFDYYVTRNFAKIKHYQEEEMTRGLHKIFSVYALTSRFETKKLGNDDFHINIPFVSKDGNSAIKPLCLSYEKTTKIYEHGDQWISRIKRLQNINYIPNKFLFAIKKPAASDNKKTLAFLDIQKELINLNVETVDYQNEEKIIEFARL